LPNPRTPGANEWVELSNDTGTPADLSGWSIDDAAGGGAPYRLPDGSTIAPRGLLRVDLPKALFNNAGDSVRLLRPDGGVADQYSYGKADADLSFCRVEGIWSVCAPTPAAPNHAASQAAPAAPTAAAEIYTASLTDVDRRGVDLAQPSAASPAPFALRNDSSITAAPPYANSTAGALYRGIARATPAPPSSPVPAPAVPRRAAAPAAAQAATPPLGLGVGLFLFVAGGAMAGYDRLRPRQMLYPPEPGAPEELCDDIDG